MMDPVTIAADYHDRTKHHFDRYARSTGYLDWANQPDPFRRFNGAPVHRLLLSPTESGPPYDDLFIPGRIKPAAVSLESISTLFQFSLALSAWKVLKSTSWSLRINPSSGNLHPTEGYLLIGPVVGLHDQPALYHYAPREHALELRAQFSLDAWRNLIHSFPEGTFFVGLTSIHWREAWKYGERAYRYCQHDCGHALAAVGVSAALNGWQSILLNDVGDADIAALLGLNRDEDFADAEHEHPDLLLAVVPRGERHLAESQLAPISAARWFGRANRLSADHVDWEMIDSVASACVRLPSREAAVPNQEITPFPPPLPRGENQGSLSDSKSIFARRILFQRRSAVAFDGVTSISAERFFLVLDRSLPRFDRVPWNAFGPPVCVHLGLFVHRVDGVVPGLYFLVRDPGRLDALREALDPSFEWQKPPGCPPHLLLYRLAPGDARAAATQLSCGQDIAGDGAFSLGMIAEFESPLREYGPWFYRRLFWETGAIGQLLYLEAEAAGVRGTGIGCFFDDPVHELFGLRGHALQSLYHFTIGGPVEDARLSTRPPYQS